MSSDKTLPVSASDSDGWRAHELSQLRRFRALSLRQKLEAAEGMADVVRRLNQMRREGKFSVRLAIIKAVGDGQETSRG